MESVWAKVKDFYQKYEGRISSAALLFGFIFDNLTLKRIDLLFENLVIISYLILSGGGILLLNFLNRAGQLNQFRQKTKLFLPLFIQFSFGGLFSAFFVFYSRSASLSNSWPFILILLTLLIGNEFFRKRYQQITFQTSVYFVAIFSFTIFFLPILTKTIGPLVFVLSGIFSISIISFFIFLLSKIVPESYANSRKNLKQSIISIFFLINVLYFYNLIPPIPLSLKAAGPYYFIERRADTYLAKAEEKKWYEFFKKDKLYLKTGESAYVFSSVFAPTDLNTKIIHHWQYFDEFKKKWVSAGKIEFSIRGGRDGGFRGFSRKNVISPGEWRVDVLTKRGEIIGRVKFKIENDLPKTIGFVTL